MSGSGPNKVATKVIRVTAVVVAGVLASTVGACSSDKPKGAPKAVPTTTRAVLPNPLTGIVPSPTGPVIAVKVDDTAPGRPSQGLDRADVIYIEEVEGGLSRMLAVFASARPDVRAVRSIRSSDPELLGQYGKIIVVASGGAPPALRTLDKSSLHAVINDRRQVGFRRDPSRPAPYNVVSNLTKVSAAVKGDGVRNVGFTWAASDPQLAAAKAASKVSTRVGSTPVTFVWDQAKARYVRTVDGQPIVTASGAPVAKPNVLVQFCDIRPAPDERDVNKKPTMFTKTIGSGPVVLFRGGRRISGTWSRPGLDAPTTFRDAAGKPLLLAPGGTFVALVRRGAPA